MPFRDTGETLACSAVSKSFGGIEALSDVSVAFSQASITAIIGPNGAGKTTLLNVFGGFVRPDAGACHLGKVELTGMAPHKIARAGIGRSFQDLRVVRGLSALENVLLAQPDRKAHSLVVAAFNGSLAAHVEADRAMSVLRRVGLGEHSSTPAGELSYGQQKLLTIACCVATEPRALLLDEPVSGVDRALIPQILNLIRSLGNDGMIVVFVEHDLAAVRALAESVVVMSAGMIVARGVPSELLARSEILETYLE